MTNPLLRYPEYIREAFALRLALEDLVGGERAEFATAAGPDGSAFAILRVASPDGHEHGIPVGALPMQECRAAHEHWQSFLREQDTEALVDVIQRSRMGCAHYRGAILRTLVSAGALSLPPSSTVFGPQSIGSA